MTAAEPAAAAKPVTVARWSELADREPTYALVANVDLVIVRRGDEVSVFYGRCLHRGALLSDGCVRGDNLICGLHNWDYRVDTGISEYNNAERLQRFSAWIDAAADAVIVDEDEIRAWEKQNPQPYQRDTYLGNYRTCTARPRSRTTPTSRAWHATACRCSDTTAW